jgi:hypothetical protein
LYFPTTTSQHLLRTAVLCLALVASAAAANACAAGRPTVKLGFAEAKTVFVARVVRTEEAQVVLDGETHPAVEATVRIGEVFKGEPPQHLKVRSFVYEAANCSIPLLVGWDYVFFLSADDDRNFVHTPGGSFAMFELQQGEDKRRLDELRKLSREKSSK